MKKSGLALGAALFCIVYVAYVWMTLPGGQGTEKHMGVIGRDLVTGVQTSFVYWFAMRRSYDWRWVNAIAATIGTVLVFLAAIAVTGTAVILYVIVAWPSIWLSAVLAGALTLRWALAAGLFLPPLALALDLLLGRLGLYGSYNFTI